jgi:hypothetical protein
MLVATTKGLSAAGSTRQLELTVDLRSDAGAAIGVVVAYAGPGAYYRFSMDATQSYRRLVKVADGRVTVLFERADGFERPESHEVEVTFGLEAAGQRLRIRVDGRPWCDLVDRSRPIRSERIGLYCWRNAQARFRHVRVRLASDAAASLEPRARYELAIEDPTRDEPLYRVPFVTSAYRRFRDLVLTFAGQAVELAGLSPVAGDPVRDVTTAVSEYADAARAWERSVVQHRDQEAGRAVLEGAKVSLRDKRAALDTAYQALAGDGGLGLPLFDPPPSTLEVATLRGEGSPGTVLGFWLRSPETLDLRYEGTGTHTGRTAIALRRWVPGSGTWVDVPATLASDSDSLQVLLLPVQGAASPWNAGRYRATFTYHRNHGDEASAAERPCARPVQKRLGSDAPDRVSIEWQVV